MFKLKNAKNTLKKLSNDTFKDMGIATLFVGAISVLILVGYYVCARVASERAYRKKWQDYNECGI